MTLLWLLALSSAGQVHHDAIERQISAHLQRQQDAIIEFWPHAGPGLLSDFARANKCYVQFHLFQVRSCQAVLSTVDRDLAKKSDVEAQSYTDPYSDDSSVAVSSLAARQH